MGHTYVCGYYHVVFSTKERRPMMEASLRERLWPYLAGIARTNGFHLVEVGGVEDHAHILLSLPATMSLAKAVQLLKGGSSKWVHDTFPDQSAFAWQDGYGAFTVSVSGVERTRTYIRGQAEHHRRKTFQEEYREFLAGHGFQWDERYTWG